MEGVGVAIKYSSPSLGDRLGGIQQAAYEHHLRSPYKMSVVSPGPLLLSLSCWHHYPIPPHTDNCPSTPTVKPNSNATPPYSPHTTSLIHPHIIINSSSSETNAVGLMKMGNAVPRAGIKPTSLAFLAIVLLWILVGSLMSPLYPRPPANVAPCLRGQYRLLH